MEEMRHVVEYFNEKNYRDKVKIMIGGAPVSQRYCDYIGADVYTDDAVAAAAAAYAICTCGRS
jgi:methanogenic corrinoid protein MtbC1